MRKEIEKATIIQFNDNIFANENDPIVSIDLQYEDDSQQGTMGYRKDGYTNFIKNIMTILEIEDKSQIVGKTVLACTEINKLLALGNQSGNQWIDLRKVDKIIKGDIIEYFEKKEELER